MKLTNPWSIQVELVEGCNRLCTFCGLNGSRTKPGENIRHMATDLAVKLAADCAAFAPERRYEFAMHGEPTLHPHYLSMIGIFREQLPKAQLQITTNGARMTRGRMLGVLEGLFDAGIDFVVLDLYSPEDAQLRGQALTLPPHVQVLDLYDERNKGISPWHNHRGKLRNTLFLLADLQAVSGVKSSRVILNHAGNATGQPIPQEPLRKKCANVFREAAVSWNGDVCLCCMDYSHELVCGNIATHTLEEIWFGPVFTAVRALLGNKDRRFTPCARCNYNGGHRLGLLPPTPPATPEQLRLIEGAVTSCTATKTNKLEPQILFTKEELERDGADICRRGGHGARDPLQRAGVHVLPDLFGGAEHQD